MEAHGKAKVALTFALYQGDALLRRETVAQDIVKVGKDPRSHLRVEDDLASRMHAVIEVASPTDITLIDLGNEPGTMVNGQRVNKCKIRPGAQIQIGSTLIHLEQAEKATLSAPPPPMPAPTPEPPAPAAPAYNAPAANPFTAPTANPFSPPPPAAAPPPAPPAYAAPAANPFAAPAAPPASPFPWRGETARASRTR